MALAQSNVQDQVGVNVLSRSLKGEEQAAADLLKGLPAPGALPEGSGQRVDLFA